MGLLKLSPISLSRSPQDSVLSQICSRISFYERPFFGQGTTSLHITDGRFQVDIATSLEPPTGSPPTVTELSIPLTPQMQKIQNALLECIEVCLSELKRSNPTLDMEEWTPDAALHRNFDVTVRRILDPIWHRVSWKTRGIVADLSLLRRILQ